MSLAKYCGSLHNHTDFSNLRLRDSINTVESLIDYAIELGHEVIGITEHDTIASAIRAEKHYKKIKENNPNFKMILGNEIYLVRNGLNGQNFNTEYDRYYHFILLAKDEIGHQQIREISTRAWMRSYTARRMRRVPTYYQDLIDIIGANPGHVIGSTACLGGCLPTQLLRLLALERGTSKNEAALMLKKKIYAWVKQMQNIFGKEDFYFEMQPSHNKEQIFVNKKLIELGNELGIKCIITNDAHYLKKEDRPIHKAFLNSQQGDREVDDFYATTYLMNDDEIREFMEEEIGKEELEKAYQNIKEIKDKCEDYSLMKPLKIPRLDWKNFSVTDEEKIYWKNKVPYIDKFMDSEYSEDRHLAYAIISRIKDDEILQDEQTLEEIGACLEDTWISSEVNGSRWSAYFLNLQNIIDICWDAETLVGAGRGSGVGFILLYLLGITQINPLREKSQTKRWRFLNPQRVSVLDVDIDIEGSRRADVLKSFRKIYGEDRVANVLTLKTEKSKSAILTAARGLGIDVDVAQYLAGFIEADRGQLRSLQQTFYGDPDNGIKASKQFQLEMTQNYPELWQVAQGIEGLINGCGVHAGGVIFVDEPFTNTTALMRAPNGEIITQFDLHDAEDTGLIKYDILSIEALDKIHNCIDLICDYGYETREQTLKDTYEKIVGIYNLERDNIDMWKMCWEHKVMSLFQMEKQSGIQGIAVMKPTSVDDLAILNSAIRLMATEKGGEMPVHKLARFKMNKTDWDYELKKYGLGAEAKEILKPVLDISYGLCIAQEQFMQLVQLPELGGFDLTWADKLRKSIAKKNPAEYEKLTEEYFETVKEKNCDSALCTYVWNVLIAMSRGYGFNLSHTLAYSLIGLQELNLAFRYPTILWNCACLISDSGGAEREEDDEEESNREYNEETFDDVSMGVFSEDNGDDEDEETDSSNTPTKKKSSNKTTNYGKIATAIGKITQEGVTIVATDINKSNYTFSPDISNNRIIYGLSGITRVGDDLVHDIMSNRPYKSIEDFLSKVKVNKPQMVNLIKSGAFDSLYDNDRVKAMDTYIELSYDKKKRVTLQNMKMLIEFGLIPEEYDLQCKVYNFNKYLKKFKEDIYYILNEVAFKFYEKNFDLDLLIPENNHFKIKQTSWDKIYKKHMDIIRPYVKAHNEELLNAINSRLKKELWDKYCLGSISKWEMDSISCYIHEHELAKLQNHIYGFADYDKLSNNPDVEYTFTTKQGKTVPMFRIRRIAGTVLDRDKAKKMVTLLTTTGVVTVRIYGDAFNYYDKRLSQKQPDGTKKVIENSWFSRGNKVIVTGIKKEDSFLAKKYSRTPYHLVELITGIDDEGIITTQQERIEVL